MNFLFPAMLAGLAALSVPIAIHLISRHRFPVQDFPSLRLLQREERANVFAPKLVDVLQLLFRLLVLLLLVLAMSRLFAGWASSKPAPRNVVVVMDCSASMRMEVEKPGGGGKTALIELAKARAKELLATIEPPGQCALIAAAEKTKTIGRGLMPLDEKRDDSPLKQIDRLEATDGTGDGLVNAVALACDMLRGRREPKSQVIVFTDLRKSAFADRGGEDLKRIERAQKDLGSSLDLLFVDVAGGASENLAVVDAAVRGGQAKVGDDAHLIARIVNSGTKDQSAKVRLAVGDRQDPAFKDIVVAPGAQAVVDLTTRVNRAIRTFGQVSINDDAMKLDDSFAVPLTVADARRVLIINGSGQNVVSAQSSQIGAMGQAKDAAPTETEETIDGATIVRFVLNPGRELGLAYGTGIDTTLVTPEALTGQTLSKYDVIILYDVSSLVESALEDLDTFVRQGRSLLIVASGGCNAANFNRSFAASGAKRGILSPVQLGNDKAFDPPVALRLDSTPHPVLTPFHDRLHGDVSVIRFVKLREVMAMGEGATAMFSTTNGLPLAVEMPIGRGRVALTTFGVELDRGNIARTRVFPTLIWRMVDYLTGRLKPNPPDVLTALRPAVLDVSDPAFAFATELELTKLADAGPTTAPTSQPAGASIKLPVRPDQTVLLDGLPAGRYQLHKPTRADDSASFVSYSRSVAVHADPRESEMSRLEPKALGDLFGPQARTIDVAKADIVPHGAEFWKTFVILLLLAYAAEATCGWILGARRERKRLQEAAA